MGRFINRAQSHFSRRPGENVMVHQREGQMFGPVQSLEIYLITEHQQVLSEATLLQEEGVVRPQREFCPRDVEDRHHYLSWLQRLK